MTLLEDFEKVTDFEYIESLTNEEYLMKYVTPTLTKLIVQVAKVRPKNPVDFLVNETRILSSYLMFWNCIIIIIILIEGLYGS